MPLYPITFKPILKPRVWGGTRLQTVLGKKLNAASIVGESWELCDLDSDQSVVAHGPAKGMHIQQLIREWGAELLGEAALFDGRFPLLLKFLDARETLSVQVHPDEAAAARMGGSVRVKHEAWYIVEAAPGACIYRGLLDGVTPDDLRHAIARGAVEPLLTKIPARKGHVFYLPSGTIHALGAGILAAEVQTPSDVTFRLFDWNRIDPATGRGRELHVEKALECIRLEPRVYDEERSSHVASVWTTVTTLIRCPFFAMDRVRMVAGVEQAIPHDGFVVWMILEGQCSITCPGLDAAFEFGRGDTVLIPAGLKGGRVATPQPCMWLEISVPGRSTLSEFERPARESFSQSVLQGQRLVPLGTPQRHESG